MHLKRRMCIVVCMAVCALVGAPGVLNAQTPDAYTTATQGNLVDEWSSFGPGEGIMTNDLVKEKIVEYLGGLKETRLLVLATSYDDMPITTVAEFTLDPDTMTLYGLHEVDTEKLIHMLYNPNVCFNYNEEYGGFGDVHGIQIKGTAEVIDGSDPEFERILLEVAPYEHYQDQIGLPLDAIRAMLAGMMQAAKVTITDAIIMSSHFKEEGYRTYQQWLRGVKLSTITATPGNANVALAWTTEAESDLSGFNVYRAASGGDYEIINSTLIAATGSAAAGADYTYTDDTAMNFIEYSYMIGSVDAAGDETMHGPVTAMPSWFYIFYGR